VAIVTGCHSQGVAVFACAQVGCPTCLDAVMRENEGLIHYIIRQQGIGGVEYEDLMQAGRIALWRSILHFDPGRGNAFSSYACPAIHHGVWACVAVADQSQDYVELEEWFDLPGQAEAAWQEDQIRQSIQEELVCLPERLRQVIELVYGFGGQPPHSLTAIGRQWGISKERVRQLHNKALALLRLPALSLCLRGLCDRDSRQAYQRALSLNRAWQRSQRRRA